MSIRNDFGAIDDVKFILIDSVVHLHTFQLYICFIINITVAIEWILFALLFEMSSLLFVIELRAIE